MRQRWVSCASLPAGTPFASDAGIDVLRGPRDYTSVSQALATAGYNVDFQEMEQGASIRRRQNQAAPDNGGWSAFFGLGMNPIDRKAPLDVPREDREHVTHCIAT